MAEILIKATDAANIDPATDRMGCHKKGYPVLAMPDGWPWAAGEGLPGFVLLKVPDATVAEVTQFFSAWQRQVDWSIVSQNLALDGFRLNLVCTNPSVTDQGVGAGKITRVMVETYLNNWGATVFSIADNSVVFDTTIYNAVISQGFWGVDLSGVVFSQISYVQATGVHTIQVDYTNKIAWKAADVASMVVIIGGAVVSNVAGIAQFTITRTTASNAFKTDVQQKLAQVLYLRQYHFLSSLVDVVIANGGVQTSSKSTVLSAIKNRLLE